jgi:glutaredoxin
MSELYELPNENEYTIYTKSGCTYCDNAKKLLEKEKKTIINCDDYLLKNKELFLFFIKNLNNGIEHKTFPIIFYKKTFIGGYNELNEFYKNENLFNNIDF